jgi:hypothetical protein
MKCFIVTTILLFICALPTFSQEEKFIDDTLVQAKVANGAKVYTINDSVKYLYTKPTRFKYVKYAAQDLYEGPKMLFKKESIWPVVGVTAGTLGLIACDEEITKNVRKFCSFMNLSRSNNAKNISSVDQLAVFVPTDIPTGLYYIGDGYTELLVNGSFYLYGLVKKDNRALRTASQLSEGLISVGIWVQILKHVAGRSTANSNNSKDRWRWLPNPFVYAKHVPSYDAFPSGHLSIGMTTVTIIALNYPEKKFIKPVGYSLLGLCGLQMINNGVHWAGDYPLAILMGYGFGKLIVNRDRLRIKKTERDILTGNNNKPQLKLSPTFLDNRTPGMSLSLRF